MTARILALLLLPSLAAGATFQLDPSQMVIGPNSIDIPIPGFEIDPDGRFDNTYLFGGTGIALDNQFDAGDQILGIYRVKFDQMIPASSGFGNGDFQLLDIDSQFIVNIIDGTDIFSSGAFLEGGAGGAGGGFSGPLRPWFGFRFPGSLEFPDPTTMVPPDVVFESGVIHLFDPHGTFRTVPEPSTLGAFSLLAGILLLRLRPKCR